MNVMQKPHRDEGTAYELRSPLVKSELVAVGRGTPMGELLRRYWHPIGLIADADGTPRKIRALGEDHDPVPRRRRQGRARARALLPPRHHAYYGKVEERGLRCCYHGWLFDTEGHVLEQPCEPDGGQFRDKVRQPWYPLEERYGLIFAYMGPPEKKPVVAALRMPRGDGRRRVHRNRRFSLGGGGPAIIPCNWLQHYENVVDPFHVPVLHASFSGAQFTMAMAAIAAGDVRDVASRSHGALHPHEG